MSFELPILKLGLAGFAEPEQQQIAALLKAAGSASAHWRIGPFADSDAWWVDGSRTQVMPNGMLRISPGTLTGRSIQLALPDVDRPVAFSLPVAARAFEPAFAFDLANPQSTLDVLRKFGAWLQPVVAQFALAAAVERQRPGLTSGAWEVLRESRLIAVIDLTAGTGVSPRATPADFEDATWCIRDHGTVELPEHFARTTMPQMMWEYALRTQEDLLPRHYRTRPIYFRRPPRLPQRMLRDAHLLVMRELATRPGTRFQMLQQLTGLAEVPLARHLAALYYVGAITANAKRASQTLLTSRADAADSSQGSDLSVAPSSLDSGPGSAEPLRRPLLDLTAPAPLRFE
jgi:hypothetical protein